MNNGKKEIFKRDVLLLSFQVLPTDSSPFQKLHNESEQKKDFKSHDTQKSWNAEIIET